METVVLVKDYKKRNFSPKAAKIAIDHFGWSETGTGAKPSEVGTKTKPPIIDKPIKLKDIPIEKKEITSDDLGVRFRDKVNDDLAVTHAIEEVKSEVNDDLGAAKEPIKEILTEKRLSQDLPVKEKETRKRAVKSKAK